MKALNNIPFDNLRIAYFRVYDKPGERIFFDSTDEQILNLLAKEQGETVVISRIEDVEVLNVITRYPNKNKLDISELKNGRSSEQLMAASKKVSEETAKRTTNKTK